MRVVSSVLSAILMIALLLSFGAYAISDNALWEDSRVYELVSDSRSNNDLDYAVAKVKYDYPSNRIHILFMMSYNSFTDESNTGIKMKFNDLGTVTLMSDGTYDYNDGVYFAQIDDVMSDFRTATVYIETTVGIKSGIPKKLVMTSTIFDTDGVASNEFVTDISDIDIEETTTEKTSKTKTSKVRTTKIKTTKIKTTKAKKTTASKTKKQDDKITVSSYATIKANSRITAKNNNDKIKIAVACVCIAVCFATIGCVAGIKSKPKQ